MNYVKPSIEKISSVMVLILHLEDVGYRRYMVSYPFGNWRIPVPGCSENGYDEKSQTLHFMAPYKQSEDGWKWLIKQMPIYLKKI